MRGGGTTTRRFAYFPGCTLRAHARGFERTALESARRLGLSLEELPSWQCCGAVFPLAEDDHMPLVSPFRSLLRAGKMGADLVTLCAACYNVLKRTSAKVRRDTGIREKLVSFVDEGHYDGDGRVCHLLDLLVDPPGLDAVREKVQRPLEGLSVAPYYGCLLVRPSDELGLDSCEEPSSLERLFEALGARVVRHAYMTECCGSYVTLASPQATTEAAGRVLRSARGADLLVTSCPLCKYNLEQAQAEQNTGLADAKRLPIVYFTQMLALALGVPPAECGFEDDLVDPRPALALKDLLGTG